MKIDEFFDKQPDAKFIDWLKSPVHTDMPKNFSRQNAREGEVNINGAYIAECVPEWVEILATATTDFEDFLRICKIHGRSYRINIKRCEGYAEESYKISVMDKECNIYASDEEGARRAVYYLESELIKREGAFLPLGDTVRASAIKRRITRGFFSPTNRAPKWGDELLDEIDYYPENYLSRLAHNGTNGLWIYTSFAQLISSPFLPTKEKNQEKRMAKLDRVVQRCKRYGIRVYLFAIEPIGFFKEERELYLDVAGASTNGERQPVCPRIKKTRDHVIYCLENIYKSIPDLAGYISITAGERPTTCSSIGNYKSCPRCGKYSRGENLAYSVDLIKEGLRRAGTGAEFISWTYGHRYWDDADILEYIEKTPNDITLMQNFEDRGIDIQLGKPRIAWDYWLSYEGPSEMFSMSARAAKKYGNKMYAKMQVCSSHEIATVPYIPAPGILFDKYKEARALGAEGILECWYFGNYPSLMNFASTELAYLADFSDKESFLLELAARLYGESSARAVMDAWVAFEEGYKNYPTNIMFSYYGPMHDGVVWNLFPIPVNRALPRSWLLLDAPDGDRIGECLFKGHTLEEAMTLAERMCTLWEKGLNHLKAVDVGEQFTCATAILLLFKSGNNILNFYNSRRLLGNGNTDPLETVCKMENIVREEIEISKKMCAVMEADARVGYHSEAEGFKFFKEKLMARIGKLEALFDTDFKEIRARLLDLRPPLGYYFAEGMDAYPLGRDKDTAKVEKLDGERSFSAYFDEDKIYLDIKCKKDDSFSFCFEFSLFEPESTVCYSQGESSNSHCEIAGSVSEGLGLGTFVLSHQSVYGEGIKEELSKYGVESEFDTERAEHLVYAIIPKEKWDKKRAIKLALKVNQTEWKTDADPVRTLGKADISPEDFGFLLPI